MALEDAFATLRETENQPIEWLFGDLLRERATYDDWRGCTLLVHLETRATRNLSAWNALINGTRGAVADERTLASRALTLLRPHSPDFNHKFDDLVAEMLGAQYLSHQGHTDVNFTLDGAPIRADLISVLDGTHYVTEVKNLREPRTLSYVAFARWHRNRAADPDRYSFLVQLLDIDDPFGDLTPDQAEAVHRLIDRLPEHERPRRFQYVLPGNRRLRISIEEGAAVAMRHGGGPFLLDPVVEKCEQTLVSKLLEPTRKALAQLYSPAVPDDFRRLLFFRWSPPEEIWATGEADNVRAAVATAVQNFVRSFFPRLAVVMTHIGEDLDAIPTATWQ